MQTTQDIEKIKKEIWVISKKTIPALLTKINAITGIDVSEISSKLESQQTLLNSLSTKVDTLSTLASTHTNDIKSLNEKASSHDSQISTINSTIQDISTTITDINTALESHSNSITSHETSITTLTNNLSTLSGTVDTLSTTLSSLSSTVDNLITRVTKLEEDATTTTSSITEISTKITDLTATASSASTTANEALALVQALQEQVNNLSSGTGGGTTSGSSTPCLEGELLYDMRSEDENINHGFTNGMQKGDRLTLASIATYRYLKLYCHINGSIEQFQLVDIHNKKGYLFNVMAWASVYHIGCIRIRVPLTKDYVQVDGFARFVFDGSTPMYVMNQESLKKGFYIYRIEGIK